jgi:hypothetical protein
VHEKGERLARIDPKRAERLIQSATKILRDSSTPIAKPSSGYCLVLEVGDGSAKLVGTLSPLDAPGRAFELQLQDAVDLKPWVCPARNQGVGAAAACARPTIVFSYAERENCGDTHVVSIYADGQVHYYAHQAPDLDSYYKIERTVVDQLFAIGSKYRGDVTYTHVRADPKHRTLIGAAMLVEYKQTLTQLAHVPWQTLQTSRSCPDDQDYPAGMLSLDRW